MPNKLTFTGRIASAPDYKKAGDLAVTKFTLLRDEYIGKDENDPKQAKYRSVSIQFTAFRGHAEAISKNGMVGDQLIVEARVENNNWRDAEGKDQYGFSFIVESFEFGAPGKQKRQHLNGQQSN
jgi:single-strand DNA-binding protein